MLLARTFSLKDGGGEGHAMQVCAGVLRREVREGVLYGRARVFNGW